MKKKLCLLLALICCVAVFAVAFAACNDNSGKSGNGGNATGGAGDVIFTEDASLEEIIAALENAESFTAEMKGSSSTVHGEETSSTVVDQIVMVSRNAIYQSVTRKWEDGVFREEYVTFVENDEVYFIAWSNKIYDVIVDAMVVTQQQKNLLSNTDPFDGGLIYMISLLLTEEDGKIVPDFDSPLDGTVYVRLEGDRLVIGMSYENDNEKETVEYAYSKVNATDIVISDETKALAYEADWADSVSYNGVRYQKAEDENGEYYRVVSVQDGADPEETINGLPVKER